MGIAFLDLLSSSSLYQLIHNFFFILESSSIISYRVSHTSSSYKYSSYYYQYQYQFPFIDSRTVKTTDKITNTKRYILVDGDIELAELLAAVHTVHGLAVEAPCSLTQVDEDGDRIQITTVDELAEALAQLQAGETFRVFVRSEENIGINVPSVLTGHNAFNKMQIKNDDKHQRKLARKAEKASRKLEKKVVKKEKLEREAEKLKEKQRKQAKKQEKESQKIKQKVEKINAKMMDKDNFSNSSSDSDSSSSSSSEGDSIERDDITDGRHQDRNQQGQDGSFSQMRGIYYPNWGLNLGRAINNTVHKAINKFKPFENIGHTISQQAQADVNNIVDQSLSDAFAYENVTPGMIAEDQRAWNQLQKQKRKNQQHQQHQDQYGHHFFHPYPFGYHYPQYQDQHQNQVYPIAKKEQRNSKIERQEHQVINPTPFIPPIIQFPNSPYGYPYLYPTSSQQMQNQFIPYSLPYVGQTNPQTQQPIPSAPVQPLTQTSEIPKQTSQISSVPTHEQRNEVDTNTGSGNEISKSNDQI
ncbi:MAG: hypothetical protein EZS28_031925 [Streblomastix strix]|uniref:PB1 domain-containing protein n=1 Tax=Streblomastix strix TaxID=222440 RepID=A0A5J4UQ71_9EUKA|nr:MAG: hypothetical protein EZS28_031925 [Streblomastix strix]